jgi:hypothetical protein
MLFNVRNVLPKLADFSWYTLYTALGYCEIVNQKLRNFGMFLYNSINKYFMICDLVVMVANVFRNAV